MRILRLVFLVFALLLALPLAALANPGREAPPPPDATTTTTTTVPETTTTTVAPPEETTTTTTTTPVPPDPTPPAPTPTPQAPAPAPEPPPATPLPVPAVNASFVCPGYFVVTLGNSGNAPAAFEISLYMSETSREDAAQVVVNPGESVHFTDFIALAGEEDSTGELTVYETVTGFTRTVAFDQSVIDCVEGSESVVLLSGSEDSECRLIDLLAMMPASSQAESTWAGLGGNPLILAAAVVAALLSGLFLGRRKVRTEPTTQGRHVKK